MIKLAIKSCAGVSLVFALSAFCRADPMAYVETGAANWGTLDLTTGAYSTIHNLGSLLSGIGGYGGGYYGGVYQGSEFYSVNASAGTLNAIGNSGFTYDDTGSTTSGVYGFSTSGELYSINPLTGAASHIGATGITVGGIVGMSSGGSNLYITCTGGGAGGVSGADNFYVINTSTGAATFLGITSPAAAIGAMADLSNTLYGGSDGTSRSLWTLDGSSGTPTDGGINTPLDGSFYWGLAAPTSTPEPFTMGLGMAGVGLFLRRRMKSKAASAN